MQNRIICIDVDGTIISKEGDFYCGAMEMCYKLHSKKWNIALCSARPFLSTIKIANKLQNVSFVSSFGGSMIAVKKTNTNWDVFFKAPFISKHSLMNIISWAYQHDILNIWAYGLDEWYVTNNDEKVKRESFIIEQEPIVLNSVQLFEDLKIIKLVLPHVNLNLYNSLLNLVNNCSLNVFHTFGNQIEINIGLFDDKGLLEIKKYFGLTNNNFLIAALGDGANDKGMLDASDISFTFSDADDSLLRAVNYVLDKNREVAYKQLVEKLL